jgi:septum site-determining protein MinC
MEEQIRVKGERHGLRLFLAEDPLFDAVIAALERQLQQGEGFFRGADLMIDVGNRALTTAQVLQLAAVLEKWGVELRAIGTDNRHNRGTIREAGLRSVPSATVPTPPSSEPAQPTALSSEALFVTRTLRSGQSVRHHGPITIVGDVNPGAEVISGGNVVVWGRLRGVVHAGAMGDEHTLVCALDLTPTQLRIAGLAARSPEEAISSAGPEVAHIEGGHIVVEPWDIFRRG